MIKVYSDGSCDDRENGGFAVVINDGKKEHTILGGGKNTTSTQMELHAVISALEYLDNNYKGKNATITVDYLAIEQNLKANSIEDVRITSERDKPLWEKIFKLIDSKNYLNFKWVKSHAEDSDNVRVDKLAKLARKRYEFAHKNKLFVYYDYSIEKLNNDPLMVKQKGYYMVVDEENNVKNKGKLDLDKTYNDRELLELKLFNNVLKKVLPENNEQDTKIVFFSSLKNIPITIRNMNKNKFNLEADKHQSYWKDIKQYLDKFDVDVYTKSHKQFNFFNITLDEHELNQLNLERLVAADKKQNFPKLRVKM